jgi:hypothetical protein
MSIPGMRLSGRLLAPAPKTTQNKPRDYDEEKLQTHANHVTLDNLSTNDWLIYYIDKILQCDW